MQLRSLEIQGFKSFPDKTRLTFHQGITAVVGPNGSGKSNIADAVRWVLGEQSTKTLRGGKMEDVIFGGTQNRKPQGFAQVALTIDNTDHAIPDCGDEITVSRKLYRSGESEYKLNGANVRLKDIYELFMDTGLGRDGYSIIGQGRIAEIVGAKASQRREIFEEAAGIAKFRYRKEEAERRLQAAEDNLLRLRDILAELEGRVEPLRVQSEKAQQFLEYAGEKKSLEISLWVRELEQSKEVLRAQEDKILICRGEHDQIQAEVDGLENEISALFAKMQSIAAAIETDRAAMQKLDAEIANDTAEIAVMQNNLQHYRDTMVQIEEEIGQTSASDEQLQEKLAAYQEQVTQKQQDLAAAEQEQAQIEAEIAAEKAGQGDLYEKIDALKERRYGLNQSINEMKLSAASSGSMIDSIVLQLETLQKNAVTGDENIIRIKRELSDCRELLEGISDTLSSLKNMQDGYRIKLESRQGKVSQLLESRRKLEDEAHSRRQRAKLLRDMENNLEGFQNSVKYVMRQAQIGALREVYGPVSRLITAKDEHLLAIEVALGAAMQNIVVRDEAVAKKAIAMLKESRSGRATFLPVSTVKGNRLTDKWLSEMDGFIGLAAELVQCDARYQGIVDQLLGRIAVVEDLDAAVLCAKRGGYKFRVVTLDGQVVNAGGSMTGGYTVRSAGILSRAREISELERQAETYEEKIAALDKQIQTAKEEQVAVEAQISGADAELATAQEDLYRYQAEERRLAQAQEEAVRLRERSAKEYAALAEQLEGLKAQNVSNSGVLEELNAQLDQVAGELSVLAGRRDEAARQLEESGRRLSEKKIQTATLQNEISALNSVQEQLSAQKDSQQARKQALIERIEHLQAQIEQGREKMEEIQRNKTARQERAQGLGKEIEQKNQARNSCEQQTSVLRAKEKEVTAHRETVARELARLEEKKDALQNDYDMVIARLWDTYELTKSQAQELAEPVPNAGEAQKRLALLRQKIKQLGNVNLGAVEEYREVSQRYQFLKQQTDDAEKSKGELTRLIGGLTRDMQRIFSENFEKISLYFTQVFQELFGGGRAQLMLTDPGDVLASGIEIYAQPPGKIIKNLASLSGGEQAFVAIAIYFAILKVRPSPFCLLDEIEAALDDVNVVRYAKYLRTLCKKTQFIAITHRRGTMEEADVLYGVTMQEEGVSKLLELDVGEIESKLGIK